MYQDYILFISIVGSLFHFRMFQNEVLFLKLIRKFLFYPFTLFKKVNVIIFL